MPHVGQYCYEQPLNESTRSFLRLEHLLACLHYHRQDTTEFGRRATLAALLDILTILSRHNLRGNISKMLATHYAHIHKQLQAHSDTDLEKRLEKITQIRRQLDQLPPHFASYQLQDNSLLKSLSNRHSIPGGSCAFDIPSFQHWLRQDQQSLCQDIAHWCRHVFTFEKAIDVLLSLLRANPREYHFRADNGVFIHQMEMETQLIRIGLEKPNVYPEISAGRHRTTIRFMEYYGDKLQVRQRHDPVDFQLICYQL